MVIELDVLASHRVQLYAIQTNFIIKNYDLGIELLDGRVQSDEAFDVLYLLSLYFYTGVLVLRIIANTIHHVAG